LPALPSKLNTQTVYHGLAGADHSPTPVRNMCRNIRTLFNFDPPATNDEIRAASLQFVRKLSGFTKPSKANEAVFNSAVDDVSRIAEDLLERLVTNAPPRNREAESAKARVRAAKRFGRPAAAT
jgi:hypothetical protein